MTTINDIGDLVRVLQEQPQWAEALRSILLSRELLELPERFARFVEATERFMVATAQNFEAVNRRFDVVEQRLDGVEQRLDGVEHELAEFKAETTQRFDRMDQRFDRMDRQFEDIGHILNQMNGRMDQGFGGLYESKADQHLPRLAGQFLNLARARVLKGRLTGQHPEVIELAEDAFDDNTISDDELNSLKAVDLIFTGRSKSDQSTLYGAAEVSITAGDSDVRRALERARILGVVTGGTVMPVVISDNIGENQRQLAEQLGVTMVHLPQGP